MKKFIYSIILSLICFNLYSQVSNYTFSQSSGTYTPITGGVNYNNFTNWTNAAYAGTLPNTTAGFLDDNVSSALLPIGFNFVYNGTTYTQFGICTNGFISLGALPTSSLFPLSIGASNNIISGLGRDLIGRGSLLGNRTNNSAVITITGGDISQISVGDKVSGNGIPANATVISKTATTVTISANATSNGTGFHFRFSNPNFGIRYQTIGTAPNRTLVVQWTGFQRYTTSGAFGELYNFQIRLNETTNVINVVYSFQGPNSTTTTTFEIGLRGNTNADFNNRTTTTNWASTTAGSSNASTITLSNTVRPTSGLTFTWTPPSCLSPTSLTSSSVTSTTATISWTAPSPIPSNGYDYFLSTTNVTPTAGTTPTGTTTGTSVNLTSLTPDTRYFWWVRSNCGGTTSTWSGSANFFTGIPTCTNSIQYPLTSVSAGIDNLPVTIDNCNYQEEYATISGIVAGNTYQFGYSRGGWITIRINTFNGTAVIAGNAPLTWTATVSGTVFVHYNTNDFCGTATSCGISTVTCTTCPPPIPGCTNIYQYITANAPTTNTPLTLATNQWQDEFNEINNVVAGSTYESSYSLGGFITVRIGSFNGSVVASGNSALTWTAPSSGTYFIHYNTNNSCGNATSNGTSILTCTSCAGVPPSNDLICNATPITCNLPINGTTIDATNSGTGENQTCNYIQTQPGVWYVIDGNGETMIASLCNTSWDSKITVYSGPNCSNITCFSGNDDAADCSGIEASDTFTTVLNTKYFMLIHGFNTNSNFTFNVSCRPDLLPIQWKSFNGESNNGINYLKWVTETETNTDYFEVEKSKNGIDFESISIVVASGNSLSDIIYFHNDENPYVGENYYRIKLVNLDGSIEYSKTIVLNFNFNDKYHFYPNPFDNTITYSYNSSRPENLNIQIFDILGYNIYNKIESSNGKLIISLNDIPSGSYNIKIKHIESNYVIEQFIIKK